MADETPSPTQAEADEFKMQVHGSDGEESPTEAPANIDAPAITVNGSVVASCNVGDELVVTDGNWSGQPTSYADSWLSDGTLVGNGPTYTAQAGDAGHSITCSVTATNGAGSTNAVSNAVAVTAP